MDTLNRYVPIAGIFELLFAGVQVLQVAISYTVTAGSEYRRARFGIVGSLLYVSGRVDTDELQEMHWNINFWTDKEVMAWRDSYVSTCNAVSVAGAIFASVGLTVLQLPDMYNVHWSARGLCAVSMLLGVLSVTVATSQQQTVAMLNNPLSIRLWLSRGRPDPYGLDIRTIKFSFAPQLSEVDQRHWQERDKYRHTDRFRGLPLESSISVLMAVAMPHYLLGIAVLVFVVGFGLYLLFLWVEAIGDDPTAHRNVFILFVVAGGTFVLYHIFIQISVAHNGAKKLNEFDLRNAGSAGTTLTELQNEIDALQERMKLLTKQQIQIQEKAQNEGSSTGQEAGDREALVGDPMRGEAV